MARYGMVIDLNTCIGCNACTIACKAEHATPAGIFWGKVLEKEVGKFPAARRIFLPVLCNHCKNPICLEVCPTGATYKREDGIVLIDYNMCIGCRSCIEACPYGPRAFYEGDGAYYSGMETLFEQAKQDAPEGVVMKCNFCVDRVDQGLDPACVQTCPTECRVFGDLDDPQSKVSRLVAERKARPLLPEKGLEPSVFYIGG
ncbi:4Fe-4S dicluster domain-containing protein [bacterium]|nr:MAG: 4Fe-4S dicluster domain-containing protein [bacterium]